MSILDKHIATYTAYHSNNGSFVGGGELVDALGYNVEAVARMSSEFVNTTQAFLTKIIKGFGTIINKSADKAKRMSEILGAGKFDAIQDSTIGSYYAAYESAMRDVSPAFIVGGCECGENVMNYWNNSSYLVFQGGVEAEKNSALLLAGVNGLLDLIEKSLREKSAHAMSKETKELALTYSAALKQLKLGLGDVNNNLMKHNANMKKEFDTYAKLTPSELISQFERKAKNAAVRSDFLRTLKMLGPTTLYADKLKKALTKLGVTVKDFKDANNDNKFNSLLDKLTLKIKVSDSNYSKKMEALDLIKKFHYEKVPLEGAAQVELVPEVAPAEYYDSSFLGSGETIFGGDLLELNKKVDILSKTSSFSYSAREIAFREENLRMLATLVRVANDASSEMYASKDFSDDAQIINFLTRLEELKIINLGETEFSSMFFAEPNAFGLGYSRDSYINNLEAVIQSGKSVEGKVGSKFAAFIKELENYKKFLLSSVDTAKDLVSKQSFNSKFFGGLQTTWSYSLDDVIESFSRGILVSQMRTGLDHSAKELEKYTGEQTKMNAKIMGKEINTIVTKFNNMVSAFDVTPKNISGCKIPKELFTAVLSDNIDGFVQLQRASQALNERCRLYQLSLIKDPAKVREISELLKKVAIDINSIGDQHFTHLIKFLEYFHVESIAKNDNKIDDAKLQSAYDTNITPAVNAAVAVPTNHTLALYQNEYLEKDKLSPFPLCIQDTLATHVPTMIFATANGSRIKKPDITGDNINAYGGKRIFPAKTSNAFNAANHITVDPNIDTAVAVGGGALNLVAALQPAAPAYNIPAGVTSASFIPRKVKFIAQNEMIIMYNEAKAHLADGVRQITSLKNLFSVFQSIDKAYASEVAKSNFSMKIGEIYGAIINYIMKTTMYPIVYSYKDQNVDKLACSHIALRKFGYDIVCPADSSTSFNRLKMFSALEALSLREYSDGADYGDQGNHKWDADKNPFPKTDELNVNAYIPKGDKNSSTYFNAKDKFSTMFAECDNLCIMSLKSVVAKIFSVLSLFNIINLKDVANNLQFNRVRAIFGGSDISHTLSPAIKVDNVELYLRLYLLTLFYKGLFFEENINNSMQHIVAGAKRMAILPTGNTKFDGLFRLMFLRKFDEVLAVGNSPIDTMNIYDFGLFIDICNKLADEYKGSKLQNIQKLVIDLVDEINKRYGIVSTDQIKELMKKENKKLYPGLRQLRSTGNTTNATQEKVDRVPPTLLDGEGGDFRNTKVDSDTVQFGETTVGRVLNIINPMTDNFNTEEILAVVYNFRRKLDELTENTNTAFNARASRTSPLREQGNISHKSRLLSRQLANYSDNRGKLDFLKSTFAVIGNQLSDNVNNDEVLYKEFVYTPMSLVNNLYNKLIAISNLYGKQKYNNILNLNTHLYDLDSLNTDLVTVTSGSGMPKLDFRVLAETCKAFMTQIMYFHNKLKVNFPPDAITILDKTIDLLINQHEYIWHKEGPLSDDMLDYNSIVFNPINDYSEFPNVIYNAGTENTIGTNSWTAYKGKGVYGHNPIIEDPRLKGTKPARDGKGGLAVPLLEMSLLTEMFSPKNPYQLFEYVLIMAYKVFYQQTGVVYQPLFGEFVDKLSDYIDFNSIRVTDMDSELGDVHKFQAGMPISDKIAIVYRTLYRYANKNNSTVQPDITLLPKECITLMKKFIPLFLFLLGYIIRQSTVHRHILGINRYSGGEGLGADDQQNYTKGVIGTHELFPVAPNPAAAADYVAYYRRMTAENNVGIGMRIIAGALGSRITNNKKLASPKELDEIAKLTMDLDKKFTTAARGLNLDIGNLSGNLDLDAKTSSVFLHKYVPPPTRRLVGVMSLVNETNFTGLQSYIKDKNYSEAKKELTTYYEMGIKKDLFKFDHTLTPQGKRLEEAINEVYNAEFMNRITPALRKYFTQVVQTPRYFNAGANQDEETNIGHIVNGTTTDNIQYLRGTNLAAIVNEFGITFAGVTEVGIPARNFGNNAYIGCASVAAILAKVPSLAGVPNSLDRVKELGAAAPAVNINNVAGAAEFNAGPPINTNIFADEACDIPIDGVNGIHGKKVYVKVPVRATEAGYKGVGLGAASNTSVSDRYRNDTSHNFRNNAAPNSSVCFGADAGVNALNENTAAVIIRFIDNINTSYAKLGSGVVDTLNEAPGLFADAILMYNKYLKFNNNAIPFEEYLAEFIKERIDLIMGRDSEAFASIVFSLLPTMRWSGSRDFGAGGQIDANRMSARSALVVDRPTFRDEYGVMIGEYYAHPDSVKQINEAPGMASLGVSGIQRQSDIYNEFKFIDCNPYYDMLLSASFSSIISQTAAAVVNPVTRKGLQDIVNFIDPAGAVLPSTNALIATSNDNATDRSHNRSMNGLTRIKSQGWDGEVAHNQILSKHHYLLPIYELMLRHVCVFNDARTFRERYDGFKSALLDGFLRSYTHHTSYNSLVNKLEDNKTYKYLPVISTGTYAPAANVLRHTPGNIGGLHKLMYSTNAHKLGNLLEVGSFEGAGECFGVAIPTAYGATGRLPGIKAAEDVTTDVCSAAGVLQAFTMPLESIYLEKGAYSYPILTNTSSNLAIKHRMLYPIFALSDAALRELQTAIRTIEFNIPLGNPFSIPSYIKRILSLDMRAFTTAVRILYKLCKFGCFMFLLSRLAGRYPTVLITPTNPNSFVILGVYTPELRKAVRDVNTIYNDATLDNATVDATSFDSLRLTTTGSKSYPEISVNLACGDADFALASEDYFGKIVDYYSNGTNSPIIDGMLAGLDIAAAAPAILQAGGNGRRRLSSYVDVGDAGSFASMFAGRATTAAIVAADSPVGVAVPFELTANNTAANNLKNTILDTTVGGQDGRDATWGDIAEIRVPLLVTAAFRHARVALVGFTNNDDWIGQPANTHLGVYHAAVVAHIAMYDNIRNNALGFGLYTTLVSEAFTTNSLRKQSFRTLSGLQYTHNSASKNVYPMCSHLDAKFIEIFAERGTFESTLEAIACMNILSSRRTIQQFLLNKAMSSAFNESLLLPILNYSIVGKSYSTYVNAVPANAYCDESTQQANVTNRIGPNVAGVRTIFDNINLELTKIYKLLLKTYISYDKGILSELYFSPSQNRSYALNSVTRSVRYREPSGPINTGRALGTGTVTPALAAAEQTDVNRTAAADVVRIQASRTPAFVDENLVDQNCIMSDLMLGDVTPDDMKARSKNAVILALALYKSMMSVYSEIGDSYKYLEVDENLADLKKFMNIREMQKPFTYAVELIPNIINTIKSNGIDAADEQNILKTPDITTIKSYIPLGLKCRNIYDLDKIFLGDKSDLYGLVKIFLLNDNVYPLTAKDFKWTADLMNTLSDSGVIDSKVDGQNLSSYVQTMAKLTKYLYEIEFKSMFGNMFPVFNNLDNPKFNITTTVQPGNPLHTAVGAPVANETVRSHSKTVTFKSLQTSLPGVFSYRGLNAEVNRLLPYQDMIALTFDRSAAGRSDKSVGFNEASMLNAVDLVTSLDINSNSIELKRIMSITKADNTRLDVRPNNVITNQLGRLIGENILDIGVFPLNIHAMAKEIPMAEMINNVYTYDIIMKWLLSHDKHVLNAEHFIGAGNYAPEDPPTSSRISAVAATDAVDAARGYLGRAHADIGGDDYRAARMNANEVGDKTIAKLYKSHLYNYCVNPCGSYVYPIGITKNHIRDTTWIYYHPTVNSTSKHNSINSKTMTPNIVGLMPPITNAGRPGHAMVPKTDANFFTVDTNIGVLQCDNASKLTEEVMKITSINLTGNYLLNGSIRPRATVNTVPIQVSPFAITKPDSACNAKRKNFTNQTLDINLGVHLSDLEGKIGETDITKSKLVKALLGGINNNIVKTSGADALTNDGNAIFVAGPNAAAIAGGQDILSNGPVAIEENSYFGKQRVGAMKSYRMDLCHGVDPECQQPVLGLNIFADVLMNIYTAKLYDEIKTQRDRSSQVLIGEAAIFDAQR